MYIDNFGKILKKERKSWGMTKRKLAKAVNESEEYIELIESGREIEPDFYLVLDICRVLDISIFSLLTKKGFELFLATM